MNCSRKPGWHLKKIFIYVLIGAFIGGLGYLQFYMRRASAPQLFGKAVRFIDTTNKVISLTFDDGPNPESTRKILDMLNKYHVKATFFMLGRHAKKYPELVKAVIDSGNEVGNHSWSHERLTYKSPSFIAYEIESTDRLLRDIGYEKEIPFRAPFGHKLLLLPYILMKSKRIHYLWNIELEDWDSPSLKELSNNFEKRIKPGSIVLLHDGYNKEYEPRSMTVEYVRILLDICKRHDYQVVPLTELMRR